MGLRKFWRMLSAVWWGFVMSPILECTPLPFLKGGFVFLVHPRVLEDLYLEYGFLRPFGPRVARWILNNLWPVIGPEITGVSGVKGRVLYCPWTVEMMLKDPAGANAAIQRAARTARNMGAKWLGTGALTASMSRLGRDLRGNGMAITTGHAATTILGARILVEALRKMGVEPQEATVAIVGAGGNIGGTLAIRLAGQAGRIILIDFDRGGTLRRMQRLTAQLAKAGTLAEISVIDQEGYSRLKEADGVFTATSNIEPFLQAEWLAPWAVVVDNSQPLSMSFEEARKHLGPVLQVVAEMPEVDCYRWFDRGVGRRGIQYTCLAELVALAINGDQKGVTGPVTPVAAGRIACELERAGFSSLVFQSYGRQFTDEDWQWFRQDRLESLIVVRPLDSRADGNGDLIGAEAEAPQLELVREGV